jgi:histidine triad (HIT) family protein
MKDCLFCRIAAGEIPSKKVYADERVFAFEDIHPQAPTHVIVIPREHVDRLADVESPETIGAVMTAAARIAREKGLRDYRVVVNNGEQAGQSVFHLHVHLLAGRPMGWPPG